MRKWHRFIVTSVLVCLAFAMIYSPIKVNAAAASEKEYTITFRPGNIAEFSEEILQEYIELYGADKVRISQITGSISIIAAAGSPYPEAPGPEDIILDEAHKEKYYMTTGWRPQDEVVMEDRDYVVDYAAYINTVEYAVRYVDSQSGMDVAPPLISLGNVGDHVTYTAKHVKDYAYDTYLKEITLEEGKENTITFYYNYTVPPRHEIIELEGETIYNTIFIEKDPVRIVEGDGDDTEGTTGSEADMEPAGTDQKSNGQEEDISPESEGTDLKEEPQEGTPGQEEEAQEEITFDEEEIPLAAFLTQNENVVEWIAAGMVGLAVLLLIIIYLRKKKENRERGI